MVTLRASADGQWTDLDPAKNTTVGSAACNRTSADFEITGLADVLDLDRAPRPNPTFMRSIIGFLLFRSTTFLFVRFSAARFARPRPGPFCHADQRAETCARNNADTYVTKCSEPRQPGQESCRSTRPSTIRACQLVSPKLSPVESDSEALGGCDDTRRNNRRTGEDSSVLGRTRS